MSYQQMADFNDYLKKVRMDPECRVIVLTGEGKSFCAGFNLNELAKGPNIAATLLFRLSSGMLAPKLFSAEKEMDAYPSTTARYTSSLSSGISSGNFERFPSEKQDPTRALNEEQPH